MIDEYKLKSSQKFKKGDIVSASVWNETVSPKKIIKDPCIVIDIKVANTQSGFFVTVKDDNRNIHKLDSDWFIKLEAYMRGDDGFKQVGANMICKETTVVNIHKTDHYDVYIGRKGKGQNGYFGNPFKCEDAIEKFKPYFEDRLSNDVDFYWAIEGLRGRVLGCFCKPKQCHGDTIVEYLDSTKPDKELRKMKITSITASCSIPMQIGPREFFKPFASVTAELDEKDSIPECFREIYRQAQLEMLRNALLDMAAIKQQREGKIVGVADAMKNTKGMLKNLLT